MRSIIRVPVNQLCDVGDGRPGSGGRDLPGHPVSNSHGRVPFVLVVRVGSGLPAPGEGIGHGQNRIGPVSAVAARPQSQRQGRCRSTATGRPDREWWAIPRS